ncbi:MAG: AbrB/MazE/SpoVT family DNA-binding domain-containing protein [Thaumarchaeota archaeon]|nr:AbrB/MazE/SpoVT family DNA-binding domain-containing protein [Nitrososphaerota archaeon]
MVLYTIVHAYRVREKGSIVAVIPKELREELGIKEGTKLKVWKDKKRLVYQPE